MHAEVSDMQDRYVGAGHERDEKERFAAGIDTKIGP
jgi:hypothetical protein